MDFLEDYRTTFQFGFAYALLALATHVVLWAGVLSLAAAPAAAFSAFVGEAMLTNYELPFELVLVICAVAGGVFSYITGLLFLRLDSHWLALGTIALVLMTRVVVINLESLTGGTVGKPVPGDANFTHLVVCLALAMWVLGRLRRSKFGLAVETMRRDAQVASAAGVDVASMRRQIFALSGAIAGVGGMLFASLSRYLTPDTFGVELAFISLAAVVLGGGYYWPGPVLGAFIFAFLPDLLRDYTGRAENVALGVILLVVVLFMPDGLLDPSRGVRRRAGRPRFTRKSAGPPADAEPQLADAGVGG